MKNTYILQYMLRGHEAESWGCVYAWAVDRGQLCGDVLRTHTPTHTRTRAHAHVNGMSDKAGHSYMNEMLSSSAGWRSSSAVVVVHGESIALAFYFTGFIAVMWWGRSTRPQRRKIGGCHHRDDHLGACARSVLCYGFRNVRASILHGRLVPSGNGKLNERFGENMTNATSCREIPMEMPCQNCSKLSHRIIYQLQFAYICVLW